MYARTNSSIDEPFGTLYLFCFLFKCLSAVACFRHCLSCF